MKRKDYEQFAKEIVTAVGGESNIVSVTHCITRLRFELVDESKANDDEVKKIEGIMSVIHAGGQYQIPIGTYVTEVFPHVEALVGQKMDAMASGKAKADSMRVVKEDGAFNKFFKSIAGCIWPCFGVMGASGIVKGILTLLTTFGLMDATSGTYMILYAVSDSIMYFMPIIFGFSAAKIFGMSQYTAAVIGGAIIYPSLLGVVGTETAFNFLGIPVNMLNYTQTMLPIILAVFVASKIEKFAKKVFPQVLHLLFVPMITIIVTVPVTLIVVGPIMTMISNMLGFAINALYDTVPILCGLILGAFWQLFVILGVHLTVVPILINNITTLGYCPIAAILGITVWSLAGVSLGYSLRVKDKEKKAAGFGTLVTALCGITEPTIYTVALTNFKRFVAAFVGGGIAGVISGIMGMKLYTVGGEGIFKFASMINPAGIDVSFYTFIVCVIVAFGVSAAGAYFVTNPDE